MKNIFLGAVAVGLVSCGGNNAGIQTQVADKYIDSLRAQKAGSVMISSGSGETYDMDYNSTTRRFRVFKTPVKYKFKETVLRVDGDLIYKLQEYQGDGETSRSVILEDNAQEVAKIREEIKKFRFTKQNGRLVGQMTTDSYHSFSMSEDDQEAAIEGGKTIIDVSMAENNMLCDAQSTITTSGLIYKSPSETKRLTNIAQRSLSTCGATLSTQQLKAIDLSKVDFCDETIETDEDETTDNCSYDQDMSHLTADL